ncbi:aldo/keto reductase [Pseudomarimonas salicorniae]|uniref:Aldo/keto reductase n=1 Tax=Pseudomarimonas salicorniae TaxID=2933270 RepID=A0ABT0GFZ0_9GAMM|nr:aldo/keto reductase [Lysobacter sp. CAU 1642]MCK7593449.1 aldo/keto reductase [Lysobacter sp. CAU 1642]
MHRRSFLTAAALAALLPGMGTASEGLLRRRLGRGRPVAALGLGTWRTFDHPSGSPDWEDARKTLQRFVEGGGELVDSSPMYGLSSGAVGEMARQLGVADRLYYASKVWTRGRAAGRAQLLREAERFGRERLDLMMVHNLSDLVTQLAMLREACEEGLVDQIGISHYLTQAHPEVERVMRAERLDVLQINYSIMEPQAEDRLLPLAAERGMGVLANRLFAEGALFSRVRGKPLPGFAAELGITSWAQYFIKWVLGHPAVTVALTGTGNPDHIVDNLGGARGPMPDAALRRRMREAFLAL